MPIKLISDINAYSFSPYVCCVYFLAFSKDVE